MGLFSNKPDESKIFREKDEILNSVDKTKVEFPAQAYPLVNYIGGHPEMTESKIGQLILTPSSLIFVVNLLDKSRDKEKDLGKKIIIPLKKIKDVQAIPFSVQQTSSVAKEIMMAKYFGSLNLWGDIFGNSTLLIGFEDKKVKLGVVFKFTSAGNLADKVVERWKNEIISARHKLL